MVQVEEAMRTGTLLPDSATVLLEHAQAGLNDIAQQEKDAVALKRLDDAAAFAASVAKLESTKHIPLEEQVSSPGPAASTRSRIAAAPAVAPAPPGSVMPSVSVIDPVDPSRSIPSSQPRAGQITPRVASPAPGIAAVADAGLGSDSGAASIRQNQNHVRVQMLVPRAKMGLLIGTQGKNIRELLQEAKTLHAHLHVPSITSSDDKATESGGDKPVMKKNGLVIITGPRESVAKLKDKVAAIISGQTPPESRDPLAYIEPYIQWQGAQSSGSSVPKEAQRLLQLIQKLSSPAAATEGNTGDQLPDNDSLYTEIAPRDAAKLAAAKSVSAIRNQSDLVWFPYPAHYDHEMQAPATPALAAAPHNRRASVTNEIGQVQHVTKGAFGSSPSKAGANTAPISAPDISALRFKLDHVAQGLETVTRALGQLSMNLPENLEPYPSEIAESFVLKKGSKIDEHSSCAPLVVHSWRCLQHQVEVGAQEHPGRLEVIFGASGVLMQVVQQKARSRVHTFIAGYVF